jgi:isoleucyl-tRNA synthetase
MFKAVNSKTNFAQMEERWLAFWREEAVFERSVSGRKGGPRFTLYEGPPTANGNPGIHHILARIFKDVIPRYKTMKGYYAPRIAGWDTHGLPVELEVEKKLGISSKADIEKYGIDKFNRECKESVYGYLKNWETITERIAYWMDMQHPYVTMDNDYIETCWWTIKQLWDKGLIYQGYKVTPHCPRCGTSLSSHEVSMGYEDDTEDPSVYIKFKVAAGNEALAQLNPSKTANLLAWTTTPWTLPGNTALAVASGAQYVAFEADGEYLILAEERAKAAGLEGFPVGARFSGSDLVGLRYEPLYNPHQFGVERRRPVLVSSPDGVERKEFKLQTEGGSLTYKVIATDFVTMDEGTGIVHVAPAFGEVDFDAGLENDLDFVQQVDLQGKLIGTYPFAGKFVKSADKEIMADLQSKGRLWKSGTIKHTYPFCWRCATPLLYYAKQTWYIRTTAVKGDLIANNQKINWYPDYIKDGRFGDWLNNNVDWAFSRERYWGTPLPIWRCESCGHLECVGGAEQLAQRSGLDLSEIKASYLGWHRPNVDEIKLDCPECHGKMRRSPEVIDCWFDSGNMPYAQLHYPFDPQSKAMFEDGRFPADYICEGMDQTRGWFYSLHALSTLLFNQACFKNVICLGLILDAKGEKMSKTRGNVVDPWAIIQKYGADALRWYCLTSGPPGNVKRFSEDQVAEITRRFQLILWNVYSFFAMYANIDDYHPTATAGFAPKSELDRWIDSELQQLIAGVDEDLNHYDPTDAGRKIEKFVNDLSNWYVRRSRRRFWKSGNDADKLSAYQTLYSCLVTLSKLLAPFMPFMAEELYQNLVRPAFADAPASVHLCDFPQMESSKIDRGLSAATQMAIKVSSLGRAVRSSSNIKVRQPLSKVVVAAKSQADREGLEVLKDQIIEELNVKGIEFVADAENLPKGGFVCLTEGDLSVAVCTEIPAELAGEGMAREIVHRLQTMRKSAGFEIADYISVYYQGDEYIKGVIKDFSGYIQQETLARQLVEGLPESGSYTEGFKLSGHEVKLGVIKAGG